MFDPAELPPACPPRPMTTEEVNRAIVVAGRLRCTELDPERPHLLFVRTTGAAAGDRPELAWQSRDGAQCALLLAPTGDVLFEIPNQGDGSSDEADAFATLLLAEAVQDAGELLLRLATAYRDLVVDWHRHRLHLDDIRNDLADLGVVPGVDVPDDDPELTPRRQLKALVAQLGVTR